MDALGTCCYSEMHASFDNRLQLSVTRPASDCNCYGLCGCAKVMMDFLSEWQEKLHVKITCSQVRLSSPHCIAVAKPASHEADHSRCLGLCLVFS